MDKEKYAKDYYTKDLFLCFKLLDNCENLDRSEFDKKRVGNKRRNYKCSHARNFSKKNSCKVQVCPKVKEYLNDNTIDHEAEKKEYMKVFNKEIPNRLIWRWEDMQRLSLQQA